MNPDPTRIPRFRGILGATALTTLAAAGALTFTPTAQAATTSSRADTPVPPMARVTLHETITIPAGTREVTGTAGSAHFTISRSAKLSPETTSCSLNLYGPYWAYEPPPNANYVTVAAALSCPEKVTDLSVTVGLYSGVTGTLLSANYNVDYDSSFDYVEDNYPISRDGYYIAGAVASAAAPVNSSYGEDYSPDTYVTPITY